MTHKPKDDLPTRRDVLILGAAGLVTLTGFGRRFVGAVYADAHSSPSPHPTVTVSTPALEEGPYWVDETGTKFHRADLRANLDGTNAQLGLPLRLALTVSQLAQGAAAPLPHAFVYLWHCNAQGVYSTEAQEATADQTWLRGYQIAGAHGKVQFQTLYPGWYGGRAVHIHARVRLYPNNDPTQRPTHDFETQFFFDEAVTDHVMQTVSPYSRRGSPDTVNHTDHVYTGPSLDGTRAQGSGALTLLKLAQGKQGASASLAMVLDLTKRARPGIPPGGFGGPPPPDDGFGFGPDGPPPDGFGGGDGPPPR